jgi:phage antirepressor YoqD-like protein
MNDLSLFNSNQSKETFEAGSKVKNTTSKEVVTTKQLADILGVDVRTVQITAKRVLDPTKVLSRVINGGKSMIFDEEQATLIKQEIQKHHNLASRQIDTVSTEFEENQVIANAMAILQRRNVELQKKVKEAERQLTEQAPKVEMYNKLVDRSFCKCLRDTAQFIGEHEKHFLQVLQDKKIIYKHAGHYRAYADYADCFELKVYTYGENKTGQQLLVNIKGLELVKKIFKGV